MSLFCPQTLSWEGTIHSPQEAMDLHAQLAVNKTPSQCQITAMPPDAVPVSSALVNLYIAMRLCKTPVRQLTPEEIQKLPQLLSIDTIRLLCHIIVLYYPECLKK